MPKDFVLALTRHTTTMSTANPGAGNAFRNATLATTSFNA